jgi:hypothetical protein
LRTEEVVMKLRKPVAIATGIGAVVGGVAGPLAGTADADSPWILSGGSADCRGRWLSSPDQIQVDDLASEGNHCYVNYGRSVDEVNRSAYRVAGEGRHSVDVKGWRNIRLKVCENVGGGPDSCSDVRGPYAL